MENGELKCDDPINTENKLSNDVPDIMCLQYKFMICLKLISEELCTLATGIEVFHLSNYIQYYNGNPCEMCENHALVVMMLFKKSTKFQDVFQDFTGSIITTKA